MEKECRLHKVQTEREKKKSRDKIVSGRAEASGPDLANFLSGKATFQRGMGAELIIDGRKAVRWD